MFQQTVLVHTKQDRHVCVQMSIFCACLASYKANRVIALHFVGLEPVAGVDCVRIALGLNKTGMFVHFSGHIT
ncbi:hypothetical protein [Candidatus Enterovibrio escicola]